MNATERDKLIKKFIKKISNPVNFRMWAYLKLPSLYFWKVRLEKLNLESCSVSIPFRRTTKNPFGSTYFAALAGAAELSTGLLCEAALQGRGKWSMLVTHFEAEYTKKADKRVTFSCDQGQELEELLRRVEETGVPEKIVMTSVGKLKSGEIAGQYFITWSFKQKEKA